MSATLFPLSTRTARVIVERPALERRVTASLDAGRIPVVLGGCGTGRTSLLLRLESTLGRTRSQYLDIAAAATTPERCLRASLAAVALPTPRADDARDGEPAERRSTRSLAYFDERMAHRRAGHVSPRRVPRHPDLRELPRPAPRPARDSSRGSPQSPARFVLASRFTARVHRLLRDASARFEVVHLPPLDVEEVAGDGASLRRRPSGLGLRPSPPP